MVDCLRAVQQYVTKMVTNTSDIKILLLDGDTTPIVSLASTQSTLLSHEVYLTDRIDNPSRSLPAATIASPTEDSIEQCERELREGRYGGYWLYFTNVLKKSQIERLAEADQHELVREVEEYFADYSPLTPSHFSLNLMPTPLHPSPSQRVMALYGESPSTFSQASAAFTRHVEGLTALLLSLKKKPVIRYERMSPMAKKLGQEILFHMNNNEDLWDFRKTATAPLLLLLDRRNDPVTPLLSQWTYQAMVHELLGIANGRVSMEDAPEVREELKEIVLSTDQDPFFAANLYENFGDLGAHLQAYVADYSTKSASSRAKSIETVADMKRFIEEYPEFRKLGGNVSKHVALVGELSRLVNARKLLEVSELEQSLASNESHSQDLRNVRELISSPAIESEAKLRLAILYALRYQKLPQNQIVAVVDLLKQQEIEDAEMVYVMLNFAGAEQRQDDLFANENIFSRGKSALKGLKGVENVYTQHTPHMAETIELLVKGRLKETSYPFIEGQNASAPGVPRAQDVIIFVIGGTTYEEAKTIANMNAQFASGHGFGGSIGPSGPIGAGTRLLLGGTCVHNSKTFLQMVRDASFGFPASAASSSLAVRSSAPASAATTTASASVPASLQEASARGTGLNVNLGPVSFNVGGQAGDVLEEGVETVKDGLKDLFSRARRGVDGVRLG
ncbi:vacuolar protein sorting-associated protein 45 [Microbotryomycetes sp. JL201]|nr:vacuolar protein sorting-associated protein 45 [Microbotryomycetes sp. JL201]